MNIGAKLAAEWAKLFDAEQKPVAYLARIYAFDLPITFIAGFLIDYLWPLATPPKLSMAPTIMNIAGICLIAPALETLLMMALFWALRFGTTDKFLLTIWSAVIWAGMHSISAPQWGLGVLWGFALMSICFLTQEQKGKRRAYWMTMALHSIHNSFFFILAQIWQN